MNILETRFWFVYFEDIELFKPGNGLLFKLKTEDQTSSTENLAVKVSNSNPKLSLILG